MTYLGTATVDNGRVAMPDSFAAAQRHSAYEAIEIGDDILLIALPLDRTRLRAVEQLAAQSINEHRKALEGLAR